jgi:predicted DNA-binding protein YlxM (UPF0122 family)
MNRVYLNDLYDIYSELLTDKEKEIFEDYYQNDLSLSEISENNNVSRNAIHKSLKTVEEKLNNYEAKLNIYKKKQEIIKLLDKKDYDSIYNII